MTCSIHFSNRSPMFSNMFLSSYCEEFCRLPLTCNAYLGTPYPRYCRSEGKKWPFLFVSNYTAHKLSIFILMFWTWELICYIPSENLYFAELKHIRYDFESFNQCFCSHKNLWSHHGLFFPFLFWVGGSCPVDLWVELQAAVIIYHQCIYFLNINIIHFCNTLSVTFLFRMTNYMFVMNPIFLLFP